MSLYNRGMTNEEAMEIVLEAAKHRASILPPQNDTGKKILAASRQLQARLQWQKLAAYDAKYASHYLILED